MAKAWSSIASTEVDSESPLTETLFGKFWDREESLVTCNADLSFAEFSTTSTSYQAASTLRVFVPPFVTTGGGTAVTLVVVFEAKASDASSSANIHIKLGASGTWQVQAMPTSTTAYTRYALTIPAADVNSNANTEALLYVEIQRTAGAGTVYVRNIFGAASRFERA